MRVDATEPRGAGVIHGRRSAERLFRYKARVADADEHREILIVAADRTAASDELLEAVRAHAEERGGSYTLVVPATPDGMARFAELDPDTETAERLLTQALERLRGAGIEIEGRTGDAEPVAAAEDAANQTSYDEAIVSTSRHPLSDVTKMDVASRIEGGTGLPVTHVTATGEED